MYYNGTSSFSASTEQFQNLTQSGVGNPVWFSTTPVMISGVNYTVHFVATDLANNAQPLNVGTNQVSFTFDTSSPTTGVSLPQNNHYYSSITTISGTAADNTGNAGINKVEVAIEVDTGVWYNGTNNFNQGTETFFTV